MWLFIDDIAYNSEKEFPLKGDSIFNGKIIMFS